MHSERGWTPGQRALLRFLEQRGVIGAEPAPPTEVRPGNADLFEALAGSIEHDAFVTLVAEALRLCPVDLGAARLMPDVLSLVPAALARAYEIVPLGQHDDVLEIAASNPLDLDAVKAVEFTTGLRVRVRVAGRDDVCRALARAYGESEGATTEAPEPTDVDGAAQGADEIAVRWSLDTAEPAEVEPADCVDVADTDASPACEATVEPAWSLADPPDVPMTSCGSSTGEDPDAPAEPITLAELGRFDDVRLEIELPPTPVAESDGGDAASAPLRLEPTLEPEPVVAADQPAPLPDEALPTPGPAIRERPAVLVVTPDLNARVAVRGALEAAGDGLRVFTMRDAAEARAVLALGGVSLVLADAALTDTDGLPLWQALCDTGVRTVCWGSGHDDVTASVSRDLPAEDVVTRIRPLVTGGVA